MTGTKKGEIALTINREGAFKIPKSAKFTNSQCGITGKQDYEYKVEIEATNKALIEPEMFVIDNIEINQYFQDRYVKKGVECFSCEVMVCEAINHFKSLFFGKGAKYGFIDARRIKVILRGSPMAYIEGEWKKNVKK